jgi:hypothetical protein
MRAKTAFFGLVTVVRRNFLSPPPEFGVISLKG